MANTFFSFRQFTVHQDQCAMKVTTDACLFGAWAASLLAREDIQNCRILDAGAGTGLLSLMLAQQVNAGIEAIEIDPAAYTQALENIQASPWSARISLYPGDFRLYPFPHTYHFLVSNPPWYEGELKSPDGRKNTAHHSTELTLQQLFTRAGELLEPGGWFFILLPFKKEKDLEKLMQVNNWKALQYVRVRPSAAQPFFRIMAVLQMGNYSPPLTTEEINIWESGQLYSPGFTALLNNYYLNL